MNYRFSNYEYQKVMPKTEVRKFTRTELVSLYSQCLYEAMQYHPEDYFWSGWPDAGKRQEKTEFVVNNMVDAMRHGTYSKDGRAIKLLHKRLGVPHTYRDFKAVVLNNTDWTL